MLFLDFTALMKTYLRDTSFQIRGNCHILLHIWTENQHYNKYRLIMISLPSIRAPLLSAQSHLILIETAAKDLAEDFHSFTRGTTMYHFA